MDVNAPLSVHHVLVALAILTRLVYFEFPQKPKTMFAPPATTPVAGYGSPHGTTGSKEPPQANIAPFGVCGPERSGSVTAGICVLLFLIYPDLFSSDEGRDIGYSYKGVYAVLLTPVIHVSLKEESPNAMCTYSFQRMVCCCAKGPECPQMARGRAMIGSEAFHFIDMFYAVDDLGSACDYQRRLFGRNAGPTMHCPRYAFDDKRIIKGSYRKSELACVKCAETCAPPSCTWQAPRAEGKEEGK